MSVDDSHKQTIIIRINENQFPEVFDFNNRTIDPSPLTDAEYIKSKVGDMSFGDILALPTAGLNPFVLKKNNMDTECAKINSLIASEFGKIKNDKKIAGVIGGTGISTDPFGETSFTELISAYDEQVNALDDHVDLFIIDRISSMPDMRAALLSCKKTDKAVLICIDADHFENTGNNRVSSLTGLITAQEMGADGYGVAFSKKQKDEDVAALINELTSYSKIPLMMDLSFFDSAPAEKLTCLGVDMFICSVKQKPPLRSSKKIFKPPAIDDFFVFTHYGSVFFLKADTTEISEPIRCQPDMEDIITEVCSTSCDVLRVEINSSDDAIDFARNSHMSTIPVMFVSENLIALKMALMLYQGIALIDSSTLIPKKDLEKICKKYGAVVY